MNNENKIKIKSSASRLVKVKNAGIYFVFTLDL